MSCPTSSCASARSHRSTTSDQLGPLQGHRRAGPEHAGGLPAARRLLDAAQGAADGAGRRARRDARVQCARPRRRRVRDGPQDVLHPQGGDGQVPRLQRRRVRAGHVQRPRADAEEPASADRGHHHRRLLHRREQVFHLRPRRVPASGRRARRRGRRGARGRLPGREHPRVRAHDRPRRPPRRRRLHLRRGDRAAGRTGGQARQPAPEAAVPGRAGPLPGPDAGQQRRDADERPLHPLDRRRGVRQGRDGDVDGHEGDLDLGPDQEARQLRDRARHAGARDPLRHRRGPARRGCVRGVLPRRLKRPGAAADRRGARPRLRLRHARQGRLDARLRRDHRVRRLDLDHRRRIQDRALLPARVVRQVLALPRGHELDREDAPPHQGRRRHPDGPRHHRRRVRPDHGQLPVRAGRRDGDAGRLDDQALPRRVRGLHGGQARRGRARACNPAGQPRPPGRSRADARARRRRPRPGQLLMPRPTVREITFSIDGREVRAPEGLMLVDGAKYGDVEIPVFCYEPKLGPPVGACRMCLVEIEGIPKLQTACSTAIRDGMVVHTQTERVHEAQRAVVEFLLINHPLDCPVCDKGGECPLQDIPYGWGPGPSRFIEPKRHFKKPLELSPLVAIDRVRCILCYRCVRFSQEVSEDYQLILLERGANSFVGTFDGHPYVAPFSGNIIELCPVGALTSRAYRFRARPWDVEGAGTVCADCPAQCNVELTVRDERVLRVLGRDNEEVDDGWLCDKGRFSYQAAHVDEGIVQPLVREGTELQPASWEKAISAAASALKKAGDRASALAAGTTSNEEAFLLQRLIRGHLGSSHLSSRVYGEQPLDVTRALADPRLQATVPDLEFAHTVLLIDCDPIDEAPVWDLRIRKGIRRHGAKLVVASARPTALDASATAVLRYAPGAGEAFLVALDAALSGDDGNLGGAAAAAGTHAGAVKDFLQALRAAGEEVVIVYGERLLRGQAGRALLNIAQRLGLGGRRGPGLLELPLTPNGRGVREAGFAPGHGPGYGAIEAAGRDGAGIAEGLASGELHTVWLHHADPLRTHPDRKLWDQALHTAQTVIAVDSVLTDSIREHADVVFPAEAYPEKEGTLVHPDGRVQRLRPSVARARAREDVPGSGVRALWQVISDVSRALGHSEAVFVTGAQVSQELFAAVP